MSVMTMATAYRLMPEYRRLNADVKVPATTDFSGMHLRKFLFGGEECAFNPHLANSLFLSGLFDRLVVIAVPAFYLPGTVQSLRTYDLPAVRTLVIRTRGDLFDIPGGGFHSLPALESVIFESGFGEGWVDHDAEDVMELLELLVPPEGLGKFELELYHVRVVGMTEELWAKGVAKRMYFTAGSGGCWPDEKLALIWDPEASEPPIGEPVHICCDLHYSWLTLFKWKIVSQGTSFVHGDMVLCFTSSLRCTILHCISDIYPMYTFHQDNQHIIHHCIPTPRMLVQSLGLSGITGVIRLV
jgi:hypothetical protein